QAEVGLLTPGNRRGLERAAVGFIENGAAEQETERNLPIFAERVEILRAGDVEIVAAGDGQVGDSAAGKGWNHRARVRPEHGAQALSPLRRRPEELEQRFLLPGGIFPPAWLNADLAPQRDRANRNRAIGWFDPQLEDQQRDRGIR